MNAKAEALPSSDQQFYPTPPHVAERMLADVKWGDVSSILEPSAGKGDLANEILKRSSRYSSRPSVDCIEIDPNLRAVLSDMLGGSFYDASEHNVRAQIVHDDFLTYEPLKYYDLIVMNPPFADGVKHLAKALDIQKDGGDIICLLNAETIRNPYNKARQQLLERLDSLGASYEYMDGAFKTGAERKADVDVVIVRVSVPVTVHESDIYERLYLAENVADSDTVTEGKELDFTDYIKSAVSHYRLEARCLIELYRKWKELTPYIRSGFSEDAYERTGDFNDYGYMVYLTTGKSSVTDPNDLLLLVRMKYWRALFKNPQFVSKLPSKVQEEYLRNIDQLSRYDFSEFNIQQIAHDLNSRLKSGLEEEIEAMYARLTEKHSWLPECDKNAQEYNPYRSHFEHYENAWSTNKAHKVGKKVILPTYGVFSHWDGQPSVYDARKTVEDMERILNYFAGEMSSDVNSWAELERQFRNGVTKNIQLKWFKVTFYKKGTVHIVFTAPELIDHLNIYMGLGKGWLPPSYGRCRYADMPEDEKAVVDSFNGGEKEYEAIYRRAAFYLSEPTNNQAIAALTAGSSAVS